MKAKLRYFFNMLALLAGIQQATAQGTVAFTYQGQLRDGGTNANGTYSMTFKLYDAVSSGNQIGSTIATSPTLANGLFTVNLDFGAGAFNGNSRWLEITVAGDTLAPRVQVLPAPYAQFAAVAATVTNGAIMNAQLAGNAVNSTNIASGQIVKRLNGLTDSVTLAAGANVILTTNGNSLQISVGSNGGAVPNGIQIFSVSGTFTVPTNITRIMVEMWGGGGAGGAGAFTGNTDAFGGGGGGSGGFAKQLFTVTPGSNFTVVVGTGGTHNGGSGTTSSFGGTMLVANGGGGGTSATGSAHGLGGAKAANSVGSLFPSSVSHAGEDGVGNAPFPPDESAGGNGAGVFGLDSRGFGGRLGGGYDGLPAGVGGGGGGGGASAVPGVAGSGGDGGTGLVVVTY